jgi:hypothetical protein
VRPIHLVVIVVLLSGRARADGVLISWSPTDLEGMTEVRWNAAKKLACKDIAPRNAKVASWPEAYEVLLGANANAECKEMLAALAAQITDRTATKLAQTRRLIVWQRVTSGEILFAGKGIHVDDDVFTVGGRANWLLRTVMKKNFGTVTRDSTKESLAELQARWNKLLGGGTVAEVAEAYPTKTKGLSELRSPAAIEALIASLKPSAAKDAETKKCLRDIYKLATMPTQPDSPARVCDTDFSANGFLKVITAVPDEHPYAWWAAWWQTNGTRLSWSSDKGKFLTP